MKWKFRARRRNAIHGHDLTLGTGSYDGIFGAQSSLRYKNFFAEPMAQFTLRGDGSHDYHFANDLTWNAGPGYYLVRKRETLVGCQCAVSGESKDVDRFQGRAAEDTGVTSVFVWPANHCVAQSNQCELGRRISGIDEHDRVSSCAGLSFAREYRRKLVKIWRTALLVYRELHVHLPVDGRKRRFHHVASEQEVADALNSLSPDSRNLFRS